MTPRRLSWWAVAAVATATVLLTGWAGMRMAPDAVSVEDGSGSLSYPQLVEAMERAPLSSAVDLTLFCDSGQRTGVGNTG